MSNKPANLLTWKRHQPATGPEVLRAYLGEARVGVVCKALSGGGYTAHRLLPGKSGDKPTASALSQDQAVAWLEESVRSWVASSGLSLPPQPKR